MKNKIFLTTLILTITGGFVIAIKPAIASVTQLNNQFLIATESQPLNTRLLEQQAKELYDTGRLSEAVSLLQQAINIYQAEGKLNQEIMAWRNLALIYQKLGDWQQGNNAIEQNFNLIAKLNDTKEKEQFLAQNLEVKGLIQLSIGQNQEALNTWIEATNIYQKLNDTQGIISNKINQTQALQALGLYYQAQKTLIETIAILSGQPDSLIKAKSLQTLGDVLRGVGELEQSQNSLDNALTIAKKLPDQNLVAEILISLGKTARLQPNDGEAKSLTHFKEAEKIALTPDLLIQTQLHQLDLLQEQKQYHEINDLIAKIESILPQLPPNRTAIYARISLAKILLKNSSNSVNRTSQIHQLLTDSISLSQNLGFPRSKSEAMGLLANLYEKNQQ
jgi:tetratricopeptide (TPR) repeat protein